MTVVHEGLLCLNMFEDARLKVEVIDVKRVHEGYKKHEYKAIQK